MQALSKLQKISYGLEKIRHYRRLTEGIVFALLSGGATYGKNFQGKGRE
jgi:hypothetical protein